MTASPTPFDPEAALQHLRGLADLMSPTVLRVAATVGLPTALNEAPCTAAEAARRVGCDASAVEVVLDYLTMKGVTERASDGTFSLTPMGELILPTQDNGFHNYLDLRHGSGHMATSMGGLLHAVEHGGSAYDVVHGRSFWEAMSAEADLGASFDRHLARWAERWAPGIAALDLWGSVTRVVDVAGGAGILAVALADAHAHLEIEILELEGTADRARAALSERGADGRVAVTTGSFFDPLPTSSDAYLLAQVLHDWPDADARKILGRCADALPAGGRVLIAERLPDGVVEEAGEDHVVMSVLMLALFGARERTVADYERLLGDVGLVLTETHRPEGGLCLLEARRSEDSTAR